MTRPGASSEWDAFADIQNAVHREAGDPIRENVYNPVIRTMMGDIRGKNVVDAGCGTGNFSREISKQAGSVLGIDYSSEMIRVAKGKGNPENVSFLASNLVEPFPIADVSVDVVVTNIVLDYLPTLDMFASESARVLKEGGKTVVGVQHPLFHQLAQHNLEAKDWYMERFGYFDTAPVQKGAYGGKIETTIYPRTVGDYIRPFLANGLLLTDIKELALPKDFLDVHTEWANQTGMPRFLLLSFLKSESS